MFVAAALAQTPPEVSNVTAAQRTDGSMLVDIFYDLVDADGNPSQVEVEASDVAGASWDLPVTALTGDIGVPVTPGIGKHIVWDSKVDLPGVFGTQYKVRVCADDLFPFVMVLVPAGEYQMGDHFNEGGPDELPVHAVYTNAFSMDKFEVTNQQYADALNWALAHGGLITVGGGVVSRFGGASPPGYCDTTTSSSTSRITWNGSTFGVIAGKENHPMVNVSWYGAAAYANWRSGMEGRSLSYDTTTWACDFSASGYRLPTEAEWEKAARGGNLSPYYNYPWGNSLDGSRANYLGSGDSFEAGGEPTTTPVGYYNGNQVPAGVDMANGYGLYDMAGNVWEWSNDWYSSDYYSTSPYSNPDGPVSGSYHVQRGGSWDHVAYHLRCATRSYGFPADDRAYHVGFRLALD